jgi:hypothetical protein
VFIIVDKINIIRSTPSFLTVIAHFSQSLSIVLSSTSYSDLYPRNNKMSDQISDPLSRKRALESSCIRNHADASARKNARIDSIATTDIEDGLTDAEHEEFFQFGDSNLEMEPGPTTIEADTEVPRSEPLVVESRSKAEKSATRVAATERMKAKKRKSAKGEFWECQQKANMRTEQPRNKATAIAPAGAGTDPAPKKRCKPKCGTCKREGHIKTNKKACPALNGEWTNGTDPNQIHANEETATENRQPLVPAVPIQCDKDVSHPKCSDIPLARITEVDLADAEVKVLQHPRKDSHKSKKPASTLPAGVEIIDLEDWTATVIVNNIQIGTVTAKKGITLLDPLPTVIGPITDMNGFVQGPLSMRKRGKGYLNVGGSLPTDSAIKRGGVAQWGVIDSYELNMKRDIPCKEFRINVFEGVCIMLRDGFEVSRELLVAIEERKKVQISSDGSVVLPQLEEGTYEQWRVYSNERMGEIRYLRNFPRFPKNVDLCQSNVDGCKKYKQINHHQLGSDLGACVHDIMHFIRHSATAKKQGWQFVIEEERWRFQLKWSDIEDEELRQQMQRVVNEYLKHLDKISLWIPEYEQEERERRHGYV